MLLLKRKIKDAYFEMRQTPAGMYENEHYYFDVYILTKDNKQVKETICKRLLIRTLSQSGVANFEILERE